MTWQPYLNTQRPKTTCGVVIWHFSMCTSQIWYYNRRL